MQLDEILLARRSRRAYLPTPVAREMLEQLITAATLAPTSCNLQVTQYIVIDDAAVLERLKKEVSYKFNYSPAYIIVLYDPRFTVERHSVVTATGMAVENILLKAVDLGLATCPMAGFQRDERLRSVLSIPDELEIALIVAVGYSDPKFHRTTIPKLPKQDVFSYNRYESLPLINDSRKLRDHTSASITAYRKRIAPVYLDRFRLNTWSENDYRKVYDLFKKVLASRPNNGDHLDVLSYDGFFLKVLSEDENKIAQKTLASDYLQFTLDFFKKYLNFDSVLVDEHNTFTDISSQSIDIASYIFQIEFTPQRELLLRELHRILKKDGILFIATMRTHWYRSLGMAMQRGILRSLKKKVINIYENNPSYKVGPMENLPPYSVKALLRSAGFKKIRHRHLKSSRTGAVIDCYTVGK